MTGAVTHSGRHHGRMPLRAGILTLALLLLMAGPARAAFDVTAFEVTPADPAAGAHSDVTIAASFPPYNAGAVPQRPRNITFHLPPGLAGDPFATPRCAEAVYRADECPPATQGRDGRGDRHGGTAARAAQAGRHRRPLQPRAQRVRAGAPRRGPAPDRRRARQAVRADGDQRARERRRPRLRRHRTPDAAAHDRRPRPALHGADGVHAAGPSGRRDRSVHAQPHVVQARGLDRRGDAVRRRRRRP